MNDVTKKNPVLNSTVNERIVQYAKQLVLELCMIRWSVFLYDISGANDAQGTN